jgi:hypothetical protein
MLAYLPLGAKAGTINTSCRGGTQACHAAKLWRYDQKRKRTLYDKGKEKGANFLLAFFNLFYENDNT